MGWALSRTQQVPGLMGWYEGALRPSHERMALREHSKAHILDPDAAFCMFTRNHCAFCMCTCNQCNHWLALGMGCMAFKTRAMEALHEQQAHAVAEDLLQSGLLAA